MGVIGSFQVFTQAYVMTDGGPAKATLFYVLLLYRHSFEFFNMGYGAALSWLLFFIIMALTLLVFKSSPVWVHYSAMKEDRS
jgi:multiple sugar transport system permease protein